MRHTRPFCPRPALLALAGLALASLAFAAPAPPPNTVAGRVVDERGRPVPGARVFIEAALFSGLVTATTDAQGRYQSVELSPAANPFTVTAYKEVRYHGQVYCLRLSGEAHPYHDPVNTRAGVTRDFVWRVRGPSDQPTGLGGDHVWGGTLRFEGPTYGPTALDPDDRVEVTLVPDGPLIDGSEGRPVTRVVRVAEGLDDVPAGAYRLTAVLLGDDGARTPLRVGTRGLDGDLGASTPLLFRGYASCGHSGTLVSTPVWLVR